MTEVTEYFAKSDLQVVHAIPGRVRLRATAEPTDETNSSISTTLDTLAQQIRQQNGVIAVNKHQASNSLVATFDPKIVPLPEMLEILQNSGVSKQQAGANSTYFLPIKPESIGEINLQPEDIAQTAIPLIAGMAITSALGVQGVMALPVYMATEVVTREVIKQVTSQIKLNQQDSTSTSISTPKSEESKSKEVKSASPLKPEVAYSIVHAIPGRIRFRIPRIINDSDYVNRLTSIAESDSKVTSVRINTAAAAVVFNYETSEITEVEIRAHLISLIQRANDPNIPINLKSNQPETEPETNPWSNLALPAVTTTLAVLGGPMGIPIPPFIIGGTIAIAAIPVAQRALDSIINEQRLNIDFLDFAAITISTLQGYYLSPSIMLVLIEIGEAIREQTARSSKRQTLDLLDSLKQFVWVERDGQKQEVSIHDVKPGDVVIVYPGDQIPVDGRILRGKALIDEQKLTGESMPVMRTKGQTVHASTLIREGQLYILTEFVGADTRAGQIIKVMQDAPVHDTRIENYAAKVADSMVVPTLLLSGMVFGVTGNLARAASVLTLDFATGIRVSVPTTVLAALTHAARRGILIRSGRALEKLAQVDAVVFDKTGTLTQGEAVVVSVETVDKSVSPLTVLELAAAAEQRLTHPVAEAVVRYAQSKGAKELARGKWHYEIGLGVRAEIDGKNVLVGSDRFLQQEGISTDTLHKQYPYLLSGSSSLIYVASNNQLQGVIAYRDPLRPESPQVIQGLRQTNGVDIHILTGDNKRTAAAVAQELGIPTTNTHAEAFPEKKVAVVKGLHDGGKTVAFVGDGINDSPALAYADVSVSFASGSDVARETADVVLMENNLEGLPEAIAIARQALQLINQNTGIVAVPNLTALALAVFVGIDPLAATIVNNGSAILAGLNGLRPLLGGSHTPNNPVVNLETEILPTTEEVANVIAQPATIEMESVIPFVENSTNGKTPHPIDIEIVSVTKPIPLEIVTSPVNNSTNGKSNGKVPHSEVETEIVNVTKPVQHSTNGKSALVSIAEAVEVASLTATALAQRLQVSAATIGRRKSKSDFVEWTRSKDPENVAWIYSKKSQLFSAMSS